MKDAVSYWCCNSCLIEFKIEEEPSYADLAEIGGKNPKQVVFCPFCGEGNIEEAQD